MPAPSCRQLHLHNEHCGYGGKPRGLRSSAKWKTNQLSGGLRADRAPISDTRLRLKATSPPPPSREITRPTADKLPSSSSNAKAPSRPPSETTTGRLQGLYRQHVSPDKPSTPAIRALDPTPHLEVWPRLTTQCPGRFRVSNLSTRNPSSTMVTKLLTSCAPKRKLARATTLTRTVWSARSTG